MSKRALTYARVSYDDRPNEDRNLEGQLEDYRAYCQEKGYRIVAELAEDDRGASGASWDLPMLNQALDMARTGEIDVLVTRELDRFARGLAKQLVTEGEFKRYGVDVEYTLAEYEDTPEGNLMKNVRAVVAEYERLKIAERMTRARRNFVKGGSVLLHGNAAPYGYHLEVERNDQGRVKGTRLIIYEPEARIISLIFTWYVIGDEDGKKLSIRGIAKRLTQMRVPTWADSQGDDPRANNGLKSLKVRRFGEWSKGTVADILSNETYAGVWHYSKKKSPPNQWLAVEVPAIVDREL